MKKMIDSTKTNESGLLGGALMGGLLLLSFCAFTGKPKEENPSDNRVSNHVSKIPAGQLERLTAKLAELEEELAIPVLGNN